MAERFYINCPLAPGEVVLEGPEAHHLATVSRIRPNDQVCLFNGDGREYPARVVSVARRVVTLEVTGATEANRELPFALEVAAPLPKGDRAQFLVEKLTELGATRFVPLGTRRSVVQPREAKREKLQRYVIEASKQCGRNVLMDVAPPAEWAAYCTQPGDVLRLLAHPRAAAGFRWAAVREAPQAPVRIAVGPEGGFTEEEVRQAQEARWQTVDLGPRILRMETAAVVLAAWVIGLRTAV